MKDQGCDFTVKCPCCGARLTIDAKLRRVAAHEKPSGHAQVPDIDHAASFLKQEAQRRELLFRQSAQREQVKSEVLERKFQEALKKTKDEPVEKTTREIDLD